MDVPTTCTPTKTFERVDLSPNSKNTLCLQCGKDVQDSNKRRRLFSGKKKTDVCEHIELLIGKDICREKLTNIVCRSCGNKNAGLVNKINLLKEQFASVADTMAKNYGESVTKRQQSQAEPPGEVYQKRSNQCDSANSVKRRVLFSTAQQNSHPLSESEQEMDTAAARDRSSSVSVSFVDIKLYSFIRCLWV